MAQLRNNLGFFKICPRIVPFGANMGMCKIAIWQSNNWEKLDIFFKKIAKNCHFFQKIAIDNFLEKMTILGNFFEKKMSSF